MKKKLKLIAEIASYALGHLDSGDSPVYSQGGRETVAHMVSCCLVQWVPKIFGDGIGAGDILPHIKGDRKRIFESLMKLSLKENQLITGRFNGSKTNQSNPKRGGKIAGYSVKVPPTAEQGSYVTTVRGSGYQTHRAEALQDYNSARAHDGLPPVSRMPAGTVYTPHYETL